MENNSTYRKLNISLVLIVFIIIVSIFGCANSPISQSIPTRTISNPISTQIENFVETQKNTFLPPTIQTIQPTTTISVALPNNATITPSAGQFDPLQTMIPPEDIVSEMLGKVNLDRALNDLKQLTGEVPICIENECYTITNRLTGSEGLAWAKNYIFKELTRLGYSVEFQDWSSSGRTDQNIIARKLGALHPEEEIYLIAHLDGVKAGVAADDDASGVVDIVELARVLNDYSFSRSVVLFISTGEEQGTLGAQSYLDQLSPSEISAIKYAVNIDMIGYDANHDRLMELWHGGENPSIDLTNTMSEIIQAYQLGLVPIFVVGCGWGDEVPFREKGIPTALQIQNYESERNPFMHTAEDTITQIDLDYWVEQMRASIAFVAHLAIPMASIKSIFLPWIVKSVF